MAIYQRGSREQITEQAEACRRCGCKDFRKLGPREFCRHCGKPRVHHVQAPPEPPKPDGVTYHILRCPHCGSDKTRITRTARPIRYHKCKTCDCNFKSVEE